MAVTAAILNLVSRLRRDAPHELEGGGVDLSRCLEVALYFTCVHDPGLLRLFHAPDDVAAVSQLQTPLACLLAEHGFARGLALGAARRRHRRLLFWRRLKDAVPRPPTALPGVAADAPPILFLARSQRFTRFFRPLAEALADKCAFLIPAGDAALEGLIAEMGFPCHVYPTARRPTRRAGHVIRDYARHWAGLAETFGVMLSRLTPRLVVVPEGNAPEDEVLARAAEHLGMVSACVQQGWSPILHPGFCNMHFAEMLVWGNGFGDLLAPANPRQRFVSTGNFHLAEMPPSTGQGVIFLFQGFDNWMGGRKSADDMVALADAVAAALPQHPVFIRPHPVVPLPSEVAARLARHANIRIEKSGDVPLAQAFAKSRVAVSVYSSAILESVAAGVIPVILNTVGLPRYWPDVEAAGAGLEAQSIDAALQAIVRLTQGRAPAPPGMQAFQNRFFKAGGGAAVAESRAALIRLAGLS